MQLEGSEKEWAASYKQALGNFACTTIDLTEDDPLTHPLSLVKTVSVNKMTPDPKKAAKKGEFLLVRQ